jgi:CHAP domain
VSVNAMLAECKSWVDKGYKEGRSNDTIFGKWYGLNYNPWCDMWISYCADKSGNASVVGKFAYCPAHVNWFRARNQWSEYPKVGAIVFYDWDGDGLADHVGIVESFTDTTITTYEGNTSAGNAGSQSNGDGAYKRVRPRKVPNVLGYGYPAYAAEVTPEKPKPDVKPPAFPGFNKLYPGLSSPYVTLLDKRLIALGYGAYYKGSAPGPYYGKSTEKAVRAYQVNNPAFQSHGRADTVCGPKQWAAIFKGYTG